MPPPRCLMGAAIRLANAAGGILGQPLDEMLLTPPGPFDATPPPARPDYARPDAWAARPDTAGFWRDVPPGIEPAASAGDAIADVFFVHPTTYLSGAAWNARYDEPGTAKTIVDLAMRNQASVFNACCRIFAPRYRQASAMSFASLVGSRRSALELAYGDIRDAFDHFIAHADDSRPLIIAGHSQGSIHAIRLLQERFAGRPLQGRLVAAYVVGATLSTAIERCGLRISRAAADTGGLLVWNSVAPIALPMTRLPCWVEGDYRDVDGSNTVCINPLDWTDNGHAAPSANLGALPGVELEEPMPELVPSMTGARCRNGELVVRLPRRRTAFRDALTRIGGFHLYDYNLFYANVRNNVRHRLATYIGAGRQGLC